ncbi:hypothetical protein DUI87_30608 [Hirundo rustica rustica]|uniref:MHC class II beta chain N-terminal domain-containing protein n=1 Tax=Hirundo rustica rustica TaxID=333673 RepID=A0A3M0IYC6_HIRRU|nr:hypothetical protein DUI87_30608 [Hirundo rustica rustica]
MLPGLGGFVLGFVCLGWGSASAAGEDPSKFSPSHTALPGPQNTFTTPQKAPKSPPSTTNAPKSHKSLSQCPQESLKPLPAPHGTDQERLVDRNIHSHEQLGHFNRDLGTLWGDTPDGETQAWDWDRQPECLENRQAQVDTFCCNSYKIMAMSLGLGGPRTPKFS